MCNTKLTRGAFEGRPSIECTYKHIKDKDENTLGGINLKSICDLNGQVIANYVANDIVRLDDGRDVNARIYESELGEFQVYERKVYLDGAEIGRVDLIWLLPFIVIPIVALIIVLISMSFLLIAKPWEPDEDVPKIEISDKNGDWKESINVFGDGVMPGNEGSYAFTIANNHKTPMYYYFTLEEVYNGQKVDDFPIEFKLEGKGITVTNSWYSSEDIVYFKVLVEPKTSVDCNLRWRWLFEGGDDETDTKYGKDNGEYVVDITVKAVAKVED